MKYDRNTRDFVRDMFRLFVGLTVLIGFFIVLFKMIPMLEYKEALIALIGALAGAVGTIVTYEFGSSRSSQQKDENRKELN